MSNQQMQLITESSVLPLLKAKESDIINMIGRDNMVRETSFALQSVNSNSYLAKATPQSVAKCIVNIAFTGLSLNPVLKYAYITPRFVNGAVEGVLMPSYIGLCKLVTDSGSVKNIYAYVVHDGDVFEMSLGTSVELKHVPKFGKIATHVYAVAVLKDGTKQVEVMPIDDVNAIRERSDGYKSWKAGKAQSCIWQTDYEEMCKKTVIKRLTKYLPKTEQWEKVAKVIELDNEDYAASENQLTYIETLLGNCVLPPEHVEDIQRRLNTGMTIGEAEKLIEKLKQNQLNPITHGSNFSQTDIKKQVAIDLSKPNN